MGDVMQNGGYTVMQTIAIIDLSVSVVPGIVWRHRKKPIHMVVMILVFMVDGFQVRPAVLI